MTQGTKQKRRSAFLSVALLLLLPAAVLLQTLAAHGQKTVEMCYSRSVYRVISGAITRYFSLFPFSCAELLLYAGILFAVLLLTVSVQRIIKRQFAALLRLFVVVLCIFTSGYFLFTVLWGLNYNRLPLEQNLHYKATAPTAAALNSALIKETDAVNALCNQVRYDQKGFSHCTGGFTKLGDDIGAGYTALAKKSALYGTLFGGVTARPKSILASPLLSYTGIEGIYIPFTCEPNVDTDLPDFAQAFDAAHECAHFKGFAREDEANYIAYLADTTNKDPYFRYSAHLEACIYLSNALYAVDQKAWQRNAARLDGRAKKDLNGYFAYVVAHQSPAVAISNSVNDSYLKAQGQSGVITYDQFIILLLDKYQAEK